MRSSASAAYLRPIAGRANLDVITEVTVVRVLLERSRAVGIEVQHRGKIRVIHADCEVILSAHLTGAQMAAAFAEALGREVRHEAMTPEAFRTLGFLSAEELGNMFRFQQDFEDYSCGVRSVDASRSLNPEMQTFAVWLDKARFPLR